jgi:hypothetical protein
MLILVTAHHSEREVARHVATRLRMAIPLPTTHLVKAADGRIAPEFVKAIDLADRTLLLVTTSTTSLRTAQRLLRFTAGIGIGADRMLVVAHGLPDEDGLGSRELGDALEREIYWELRDPHGDDDGTAESYSGLAVKLGLHDNEKPNERT